MFTLLARVLLAAVLLTVIVLAVKYSFLVASLLGLPPSPSLDLMYIAMVALGVAIVVGSFIQLRRR